MNVKTLFPLAAAFLLLSSGFMGANVQAEEHNNPLQFYTGTDGSYAKVTLETDVAVFAQSNSWFGNDVEVLGDTSGSWWESLVRPGLEFSYVLPCSQTVYAQFDMVQANTFGGNDAAGSNIGYSESSLRVDHAYAGWKSGSLFSSLGEDFLDISFGRQSYTTGNGFLLYSQGGSGFGRAAWWIGGRNSAEYAGVVKMRSGNWAADLVYLEADDNPDSNTEVGGGNIEYAGEGAGYVGAGFYTVSSDIDGRDSMLIYDVRGGVNPFAVMGAIEALKPLHFEAEYVYEDTDDSYESGNAWYLSVGYTFEGCPWKPGVTYRYAEFDENYDYLFYGASDWETWYQGEVLGEYVLGNSDLDSHMLKLGFQPIDQVAVTLAFMDFARHESGEDYAQEYNLIVDWSVSDNLSMSFVGGIADPDEAAVLETGGSDTWSYMMVFGSLKF